MILMDFKRIHRLALISAIVFALSVGNGARLVLKEVSTAAPLPPLDSAALRLMNFASQYYIHALGETIVPTIPQMWKKSADWEKIPKKLAAAEKKKEKKDREIKSEGLIAESQLNNEIGRAHV